MIWKFTFLFSFSTFFHHRISIIRSKSSFYFSFFLIQSLLYLRHGIFSPLCCYCNTLMARFYKSCMRSTMHWFWFVFIRNFYLHIFWACTLFAASNSLQTRFSNRCTSFPLVPHFFNRHGKFTHVES